MRRYEGNRRKGTSAHMATKLYVGNLSYDTGEDSLRALFEEAGTVASCQLMLDRDTNRSRGFAFVEMGSQDDANKAIELCNGKDLEGRALVVNEARPRADRPSHSSNPSFRAPPPPPAKRGSGKGSRRGARRAKRERKAFW